MKKLLTVFAVILLLTSLISCKGPEEKKIVGKEFWATIEYYVGDSVTVSPLPNEEEAQSADLITFSCKELDKIDAQKGDVVLIRYEGEIRESYPAQIDVVYWEHKIAYNYDAIYTESWLSKETAEKLDYQPFTDIKITDIYKDCFFARTVIAMPYIIKINGTLGEEWCVGDQVAVTCKEIYYDSEEQRIEADLETIEESDFVPDPYKAYKPVIYLYPEEETEVSVKLRLNGQLVCTYPRYQEGWRVRALPDGTLFSENQEYNYLYWEGVLDTKYDFSRGFCVKGEDTAEFLETALAKLGLTRREANEFIVFWLPMMEENEYNIISFQGKEYTDAAELSINPVPDTTIRVFMAYYAADEYQEITPQTLTAPKRDGFTAVEWGGTEVSFLR